MRASAAVALSVALMTSGWLCSAPARAEAEGHAGSAAAVAGGASSPDGLCGGTVVAVDSGQPVDLAIVLRDVARAGGALVGERHGVRAHPRAAACLLEELSRSQPVTLIAEMLGSDQQPIIADHRTRHPELSDGLGVALRWWTTGWPPWPIYAPLFASAWRTRVPVVAGDLAKDVRVASAGELATALGDGRPAVEASWAASMKEAHCGLIDDGKAKSLAVHQITRDMAMAAAVRKARGERRVALLFAGRSHVRNDRSVTYQLRRKGEPAVSPISIALFETATAGTQTDRAKALAEARGRYDYLWFVGTAEKPDACERLRAKGLIASPKSR